MEEHQEIKRHRPPRQDCIEAGFDYPHEGWGLITLAGEWSCPACEPRAREKNRINTQEKLLQTQGDLLIEQRKSNNLKEQEILMRENGEWKQFTPKIKAPYVPVKEEKQPQQTGKGGMKIEPTRR